MATSTGDTSSSLRREQRRVRTRAFGEALRQVVELRGATQHELAEALGVRSQSQASYAVSGKQEPDPDRVFAVERYFKLDPGFLSRHLGYYPPEALYKGDDKTVEQVILEDPLLDDMGRRVILATYQAATTRSTVRVGRSPQRRS